MEEDNSVSPFELLSRQIRKFAETSKDNTLNLDVEFGQDPILPSSLPPLPDHEFPPEPEEEQKKPEMDSFAPWLLDGERHVRDEIARRKRDREIPTSYEQLRPKKLKTDVSVGERYMQLYQEMFHRIGKTSVMQQEFSDKVVDLVAPLIYAPEFEQDRIKLMRKSRKKAFKSIGMIMATRQAGKSEVVARHLACLMRWARGIKVVIISNLKTSARSLLAKAVAFYTNFSGRKKLQGGRDRVLFSRADDDGSTSRREAKDAMKFNELEVITSSKSTYQFLCLFVPLSHITQSGSGSDF